MNAQLIRDEDHRSSMSPAELRQRMSDWLTSGNYQAVVFETSDKACGYALYRREPDHVYLRQFYVAAEHRRQHVGSQAIDWPWQNAWPEVDRIRLDVLVGNAAAHAFWHAVGFRDYCVTMESHRPVRPKD